MKKSRIEDMKRGWFVGNFEPTCHKTDNCEVAVKTYKAGDEEQPHYHKIATETTCILSGEVEMNGERFVAGDVVVVKPNDVVSFKAITDATNVVVKVPGVSDDKYLV